MDVPYWMAVVIFIGVLAALGLIIIQSLRLGRVQSRLADVSAAWDREMLKSQRQYDAARDVVPYLAKTSVAMFYGEKNGEQVSFAQRQDISRKVQHQNTALRRFNEVFGVTPTHEAMARANTGDPVAQAMVEELGRDDDLPPATSDPWHG